MDSGGSDPTKILDTLQDEWDQEEVASVPMNVLFQLLMFIARRMT